MSTIPGEPFLREAIRLAVANVAAGGGPFGAVVVQAGAIVGQGQNRVTAANDPTAHAEVVAIRDACSRLGGFSLAGCELYASCEPCPMCLGAILWARLDRVVYACSRQDAARAGFDDACFYEQLALPPASRRISFSQGLPDEGQAAFAAWRARAGRTPY